MANVANPSKLIIHFWRDLWRRADHYRFDISFPLPISSLQTNYYAPLNIYPGQPWQGRYGKIGENHACIEGEHAPTTYTGLAPSSLFNLFSWVNESQKWAGFCDTEIDPLDCELSKVVEKSGSKTGTTSQHSEPAAVDSAVGVIDPLGSDPRSTASTHGAEAANDSSNDITTTVDSELELSISVYMAEAVSGPQNDINKQTFDFRNIKGLDNNDNVDVNKSQHATTPRSSNSWTIRELENTEAGEANRFQYTTTSQTFKSQPIKEPMHTPSAEVAGSTKDITPRTSNSYAIEELLHTNHVKATAAEDDTTPRTFDSWTHHLPTIFELIDTDDDDDEDAIQPAKYRKLADGAGHTYHSAVPSPYPAEMDDLTHAPKTIESRRSSSSSMIRPSQELHTEGGRGAAITNLLTETKAISSTNLPTQEAFIAFAK